MIYTVTLNPAIDYIMHTDKINIGETNRSTGEEIYIGGKGINVSLILRELGTESTALGFVAGFTGEEFEKQLEKRGVKSDFVKLSKGNTRINIKIKGDAETEINGKGPDISENDLEKFFAKINNIKDGDTVVLAGSIPGSLPDTTYSRILEILKDKKINCIVDASGKLLINALKYKPFLIKPNKAELFEIFGLEKGNEKDISECAARLREMGARNVIVSMAREGALLLTEKGDTIKICAAEGKTVNSVDAGDSMVAGFIQGFIEKSDYAYALKLGGACGAATAFSKDLATREEILRVFDTL
ncbi:MAG: 1-phosphofructokinase [Clostridia bacterium]|nr:1-phosphofructokinase [Clostridia bacterium]